MFENKKVLVAGMKASGISASYLLKKNGAQVFCYDDNKKISVSGLTFILEITPEIVSSFDFVVVSPSISLKHVLIKYCAEKKVKVIEELELGCMLLDCPKIMVTGTNGKTTVVTMIEKLLNNSGLRARAMGNIGYPVSQIVLDGVSMDYAVIEVSSFQLEHVERIKAHISAILNVAPDHLDRYDGYSDYVDTKKKICLNQTPDDYLIFNNEDGIARSFALCTKAKKIPISATKQMSDVYIKNGYFMLKDKPLCSVKCCKLRGEHNKFNLLVALNIGNICGAKSDAMIKLIREYALLPNRIEYVSTINGKNYYNDSKGTNMHACRFAIESMDGSVGLIMGGSDKNEDFCDFFENIDEKVKYVAVTGANAVKIFNSAMKMGFQNIVVTDTLQDAVNYLSRQKDISNVLLSPCCASFDRYKNYTERGEKFKEAVYAVKI